jgi:histidyl-tRNA synthetase
MDINLQTRGTRIISGDEAKQRRVILNELIQIAEEYGFEEITLPSIEPSQVYVEKAGEEVLNQIYVFKDKGDRDICLRPEGTATIQLIANKYWKTQKDVKLWYFEKCWRYERPQAGRYREFYQFGIEWINPSKDVTSILIEIARKMIETKTSDYKVSESVKRGLSYYKDGIGFEIAVEKLGAQRQVCGGGAYKEGIGFALGFDRLMMC